MGSIKRFLLVLLCCFSLQNLFCEIIQAVNPSVYSHDINVFFSSSIENANLFYRFSNEGDFLLFTDSLLLSAFENEERTYNLTIQEKNKTEILSQKDFVFTIDRKAPQIPEINIQSGIYAGIKQLSFLQKENEVIYYSILNTDGSQTFTEYKNPIDLKPLDDDYAQYEISYYSQDRVGNSSKVKTEKYIILSEFFTEIDYAYLNKKQEEFINSSYTLPALQDIVQKTNSFDISFSIPKVNPKKFAFAISTNKDKKNYDYKIYDISETFISISVPFPKGYSNNFYVEYGYEAEDGSLQLNKEALQITIKNTQKDINHDSDNSYYLEKRIDQSYVLAFTNKNASIYVSRDLKKFELYVGPILLNKTDLPSSKISYYIEYIDGYKSKIYAIDVPFLIKNPIWKPESLSTINILNKKVLITPPSNLNIYYELSDNLTFPKSVGYESKKLIEPLVLDTNENEEKTFILRAKTYNNSKDEETASDESIITITIDKKKPNKPEVTLTENEESGKVSLNLNCKSQEGSVFYALYKSNNSIGDFKLYTDSVVLPLSSEGDELYIAKAYVVDKAGNKSLDTEVKIATKDTRSVFIGLKGNDNNNGSREAPFLTLEKALDYCKKSGRTIIRIIDSVELTKIYDFDSNIDLTGVSNTKDLSKIIFANNSSSIKVNKDVSQKISNIAFSRKTVSDVPFFIVSGSLDFSNSTLDQKGLSSSSLISVRDASLSFKKCTLAISSNFKARCFESSNSLINIQESLVTCSSPTQIYVFLDSVGSNSIINLNETAFSLNALQGICLSKNTDGKININRCKISTNTASSFQTILSGNNFNALVSNSVFVFSNDSDVSLLDSDANSLNFINNTLCFLGNGRQKALFENTISNKEKLLIMNNAFLFTTFNNLPLFTGSFQFVNNFSNLIDLFVLCDKTNITNTETKFTKIDSKGELQIQNKQNLINKGSSTYIYSDKDFFGNIRIRGIIDVGAIEYE